MAELSEIAAYVTDKVSSDSITLEEYITTDNILQNKAGKTTATNLPPNSCSLTAFKEGDILVANIRPYLKKIWKADSCGAASNDVLVFRAKDDHDSDFLYSVLLQDSFFDHCMKGAEGAKMPRGNKSNILRFPTPSLTLTQEQAIGSLISNLDKKIALNRQTNCDLEAMAKQLYDYWFVQFDFPNEEGKPYKSSGGMMVWNETLKREIPDGWMVEKIKDIASVYSGGTPKSTEPSYYKDGTIPWINSGELNNKYITSAANFITELGLNNSSAKFYPKDSILVALYGATAGKTSYLAIEACSNQAVCGIVPIDKRLTNYIGYLVSSLYEYYVSLSTGSARDNISGDIVKNTDVVIPQPNIIDLFYKTISNISRKIILNQKEVDLLVNQRDQLLPLLMNGQVTFKQ